MPAHAGGGEERRREVRIFTQDLRVRGGDTLLTNASLWLASRGLMLAFIAAAASAETRCEGIPAGVACALLNSQSVTADLTIGEVKTYKLVLEVNVCSDPTR